MQHNKQCHDKKAS